MNIISTSLRKGAPCYPIKSAGFKTAQGVQLVTALTLGFLFALLIFPARAAVIEGWVHRYSYVLTNSTDQAMKVVQDAAGDVIVTGSTDDGTLGRTILTIKYSGANGALIWRHQYKDTANRDSQARALAVDKSGNAIVTGSSDSGYYTAKYAKENGTLLWEKRYNGPAVGSRNEANAVAVDRNGNVIVTGSSFSLGAIDYYTAKYAASDGTLLWDARYHAPAGTSESIARGLAVDANGDVVVTGSSIGGTGNRDYYTTKYAAADGALLWRRRYNGPANGADSAESVAVDPSGNVIVTGSSEAENDDGNLVANWYTAKYAAADGALIWEKRYSGPAGYGDEAHSVAVAENGNIVVSGSSKNALGNFDYYTAKYAAADGAVIWEKRYNGPAHDIDKASAMEVDVAGNVVVTGLSKDIIGESDYYTTKYASSDGTVLWEKRYNGPNNDHDNAISAIIDARGDVVVTGSSGLNYYTAKYAATDGTQLWEKRENPLTTSHIRSRSDVGRAVAIDGGGNVVVTGTSTRSIGNEDYYTAKYTAGDGSLVWEQRYNGTGNGYDSASALALDGTGNVVVTGISISGGQASFYTAKYAAADGALLWEKRQAGNQAEAVAVDRSGNVIVAGSSYSEATKTDFYTVKYAATDGTLLWTKVYNGPANDFDHATAVAVDSSDNVIVTGSSYSDASRTDFYTAKYAAADGALLWERRYNDPNNDYDNANVVLVDRDDNVVVTGSSGDFGQKYVAKYSGAKGILLWERHYRLRLFSGRPAMAVDGNGNVVVLGSSANETDCGYCTAKFAAADGALLWEKRYNGPSSEYAIAWALLTDAVGNVVVTGSSPAVAPLYDSDYYTVKYAAADGALLWEKFYSGPAHGVDSPLSLAVSPNGTVAVTGSSADIGSEIGSDNSRDFLTVVYREALSPIAAELVSAGGILLGFTGIPGQRYAIQRAPTISGPWTTIGSPTAPPSGVINYTDTTNSPFSATFYRTSTP